MPVIGLDKTLMRSNFREIYKLFSEQKHSARKGVFLCVKNQFIAALLPNAKTMSFVMSFRGWYYVDKCRTN